MHELQLHSSVVSSWSVGRRRETRLRVGGRAAKGSKHTLGCLLESRRSVSTTLKFNELSDFVEITHPFHPLRGQRYPVVKSKKLARRDLFSLAVAGRGTLCVPREWTDRADPEAYSSHGPLLLSYERLVELSEFVEQLRKKTGE